MVKLLTMENMMNDELHNYEPTCEELYPPDFNRSVDSIGGATSEEAFSFLSHKIPVQMG